MTTTFRRAFLLVALQAGSLFAQTFTGTWQGTLKVPQAPNGELRIVFKITTTAADKLAGQMFSIDQPGPPLSANSISASGSGLKVEVGSINGSYEGRLSTDGNTITGTWTQGGPLPLVLTRATPETAWAIPEPPPPPKMMDPNAKPEFEVSTIKPSDPNQRGWGITLNGSGMLITRNTTLADLVKFAFDLHPKQVIGAPAWFDSDKFDVTGKPNTPGMPSIPQMKSMMRKMIIDRFALTFHNDKKELTAYAITTAKTGAKIQKETNARAPLPGFGGLPQRGFNARNATVTEFASVLQAQFMDQPVVDQTGLGDVRYTFVVKFTPDATMRPFGGALPDAPPASELDAPPDLYAAMEQQLGLHMQKTKAPVEVMVIDKIEKPSAN
jgi:uncharacterized protein (TIGR03435 family)